MDYLTYINQIRTQVGDTRRRKHVEWTGDGSTLLFQMPDDSFPVFDEANSYSVKLAGSTQIETTDYTLDKEAGTISMIIAPPVGQTLQIDCSAVYLQDITYLQIINNVIKSLGGDFFKEFVDDSSLTTTAQMLSLDLNTALPLCIAIYQYSYREISTSDWIPVENFANWRYSIDDNTLYNGDLTDFPTSGKYLKVRGLKTYTLGTLTSDTIDVQDRFMTIIEYGVIARYWRYRYKNVVSLISKMSTEVTRTPLQELIMLSDRFDRLYQVEKAKLKPNKPAYRIPVQLDGHGRA